MKNQFFNNKGLTLIEMVVTIALIGVIVTSVFVMVDFSNRAFKASREKHDLQSDIRIGIDFITNKVRLATNLKLATTTDFNYDKGAATPTTMNYIFIDGKKIKHFKYVSKGVYTETSVCGNLSSNITETYFDKSSTSNNALVIKLTAAITPGGQRSTATTQIKLINFSPTTTITGSGPSLGIAYK